MTEILGIAAAAVAAVVSMAVTIRVVAADGYGRRVPTPPGEDWSTDLPTRPYREM
jgi:hypothetical protein